MSDRVWYFAYGSNLDPERFRARVGDWSELRPATLRDYALRFCADVQSEGGAGAVIVEAAGEVVHGAVYRISQDQMLAMDREEFDPDRDIVSIGARGTMVVVTQSGDVTAEVYYVRDPRTFGPPSAAYLEHITRGLEAVGHGPEIVAKVEAVAAAESGVS